MESQIVVPLLVAGLEKGFSPVGVFPQGLKPRRFIALVAYGRKIMPFKMTTYMPCYITRLAAMTCW